VSADEELAARFGERFDQRIADGMLARANEHITGLPEYLGMTITSVGPGWCVAELEVRDELLNPFGAAHGAVLASLVDHVLGSAVFPIVPLGTWPATLEFKLNYLAPARVGTLSARAEVVSISSRVAVVSVECTNDGRIVGSALGTIAITPPKV
jgi:1,4-dihydroxy-2-naphthoyl-CoA hydrolase